MTQSISATSSVSSENPTEAGSPEASQALSKDVIFPQGEFWSDEPPLESDRHRDQIELLIRLLKAWWQERNNFYVTGNLTIYFSPNQKKSEDFRGPDFFVVLDAEKRDRRSWVVWQEDGKYPNVIIELLSDSTAAVDKGLKKQIYQNTFRTPDYFWFHPDTLEFKGFHLVDGVYQELEFTPEGWLWSQQLGLYLGILDGKLRFYTPEKELVLLPEEAAQQQLEQTSQQLEQTSQQLERERQRAQHLANQLRAAGIDPDQI
ncbi:Uma2 family endonuclease [Leptolyngbya sp. NK1-12]|uniref:Uma2 family endonuclease n=1 Tax=Leptolyngbya sp. NK1-12 TaxID=2547451 RepID=A0AA96WC97_9CYAN|nr:Uma2 family endonuclease [Leptolyngbya sp. NK1-12]WNZ22438.1 Uma2 family endonuclease [Leptolyngbya sp. NK1-12]